MSARIWLVVGLCLLVGGSGITVLVYELKGTSAHYEATLRDLQERSHQQDAARIMQVTFKKEVQEWKDILLRGYNPEDLAKYSEQFRADAAAVAQSSEALQASIADADARGTIAQFLAAHAAMGEKYQVALQVFAAAKGTNPRQADQLVKGQDRAPTALVDQAVDQLGQARQRRCRHGERGGCQDHLDGQRRYPGRVCRYRGTGHCHHPLDSRTLRQAVGGLTEIAQQMTGAASRRVFLQPGARAGRFPTGRRA